MSEKNSDLIWLEGLNDRAKQLGSELDTVRARIRAGFVKRAIIFIDIVGSTAFKQAHAKEPEVWVLRVRQFSELLASAVKSAGGRVVKFIGDEVMASFSNPNDALNLVARISEMESKLVTATGFETKIKVAADYGDVYELEFDGHDEPDPMGPAVDRCARIAKYASSGTVVASSDFAQATAVLSWQKAGVAELKGIGRTTIYQLGSVTIDLEPRVELKEAEYQRLKDSVDELALEVKTLIAKNEALAEEVRASGATPTTANLADTEDQEDAWVEVASVISELKEVIRTAKVPKNQYARFLFLHESGDADQYNGYTNRFDEIIEAKLVEENRDGFWVLRGDHPRNKKAVEIMARLAALLETYVAEHGRDPDDLFEWSLRDPEFWSERIGFSVTVS